MVKGILKDRHYAASLPKEVRKSVEVIFRRSFVAAPGEWSHLEIQDMLT